jgi:GTPase SAR1 family protein
MGATVDTEARLSEILSRRIRGETFCQEGVAFKVVFMGGCSVGKTSIITRLTSHSYNNHEQAMALCIFALHRVMVRGKAMSLQIWETAGQEKDRA